MRASANQSVYFYRRAKMASEPEPLVWAANHWRRAVETHAGRLTAGGRDAEPLYRRRIPVLRTLRAPDQ